MWIAIVHAKGLPTRTAARSGVEMVGLRPTTTSAPPEPVALPTPWALEATQGVRALGVNPHRGLSAREAARRLKIHGRNALREIKPRSSWSIFIAQFKSLLVALLGAAVVAALAFGEWVEASAIGAVLGLNALLGFVTELRATRSMEALRQMGTTTATVRRDGALDVVPAAELVPGDIVLLEGGDVVTADLRLLEASKLQANESMLTGESLPTSKAVEPVSADASVGERRSMLFKGTVITRGSAEAIVVATGMHCELGRIARLVEEAKEETTPLERRLNRLGRGLVWVTLGLAVLVAGSGYAAGQPLLLIIETAIALAVAAVPEGLPIIATIALARGMHRMAREHALINRLSAVETLGATSILCTDKTGTLTENKMSVAEVLVADEGTQRRALEIGVLCNNAELARSDDDLDVGDPMEVALLLAGAEKGIVRGELLVDAPEQREVAFDPELKMMATIHGKAAPYRVAVKGAPEAVLAACTMNEDARRRWLQNGDNLAAGGQRVLALAERTTDDPSESPYASLSFMGLVGMLDPPRRGVQEVLATYRRAGVRAVMVTGDHPITAVNIARATGLVPEDEDARAVLGQELDEAASADEPDRQRLLQASVYARVSPKQKLDLIALHQSAGNIVAMTGDGVNDAPALRKADIGVAMGLRGTAAAKEAADMVLADDDLSKIGLAIAEGRAIFDNIRNFVIYLLSCNISEVLVVALAAVVRAPLPLLPLQILFLNLVTDVFPALALGVGEASPDVMRRPPRSPTEPVITNRHWRAIVGYGLVLTASVLGAFAIALTSLELDPIGAVTVSFLTLALGQTWHVFNMRRADSSIVRNVITRNRWVWAAVGICVALVLGATYIPPLARLLSIAPPRAEAWLLIVTMSLAPLIGMQLIKWAWSRRTATD